jgi:predicted GNAT superfamily acetyltransferase
MRNAASFRLATASDWGAILQLQSANYIANLSDRKDGFLSAEFTAGQIAEMAGDLGITVAVYSAEIAGYLCAFRKEFNHESPVLAKMLQAYDGTYFNGRPLSSYTSYIYGPVCVGREYRGRGLLRGLYEAQKKELAGRFEVGVAFVARHNPHSLQAHVAGLGMSEVGEFAANDASYVILAFDL